MNASTWMSAVGGALKCHDAQKPVTFQNLHIYARKPFSLFYTLCENYEDGCFRVWFMCVQWDCSDDCVEHTTFHVE